MNRTKSNYITWLWLAVAVLLIDQFTKYLVTHYLVFSEAVPYTSFFSLVLFYNQGAAFSFLSSAGEGAVWIFSIIAVCVSLLLIVWLAKLPPGQSMRAFALNLILGGALGNLTDRIAQGHVIDFLLFHYKQYAWPAFNVADSAITVGAILLAISLLKQKKNA